MYLKVGSTIFLSNVLWSIGLWLCLYIVFLIVTYRYFLKLCNFYYKIKLYLEDGFLWTKKKRRSLKSTKIKVHIFDS